MRVLSLVALFVGLTGSVFINENVIFQKTNDITVTHAKWLASFVIDLQPFNIFLNKLAKDIETARTLTEAIVSKYTGENHVEYWSTFRALQKEVVYLKETRNLISQGLLDYKLLPHREKRALIPIIGDAASWLFGLVTESDLKTIRRNIKNLANNQRQIMHVVQESISILNMSRIEIAENRQAIIDLITSLHGLDDKLEMLVSDIRKEIRETRYFIEMYLKLDLILAEIKDMLQNAMFYLEHLRTQLNFLALGKLNPSTISPSNLRALLLEIKAHLPPTLSLISEPKTDLWSFYEQLQTSALLDENRIVVVIKIPLLQTNNQFEIYKVFNLPIPFKNIQTDNPKAPDMTATYSLEADALMIDKGRTKYSLLTQRETEICSDPAVKYCNVQSPIYPVNLARVCLVNLFLQKQDAAKKYCERIVTLNTRLPFAVKLINFMWVIVSQTELKFSLVCQRGQTKTETAKPPIFILEVPAACVASNDYFTLTSTYQSRSNYKLVPQDLDLLRSINISQIGVLAPLEEKYPNFTKIKLPSSLKQIKQIPMDHLITELSNIQEIDPDDVAWPDWVYFCMGIIFMILILVGICIYKKYGVQIKKSCSVMCEKCRSQTVSTEPDQGVLGASTTIEGQSSTYEGTVPSAPYGEEVNVMKRLYPMLFTSDKIETTKL